MEGVSLQSEVIFAWGSFHITNSVLAAFLASAVIIFCAILIRLTCRLSPSKPQLIAEMGVRYFYDQLINAYTTPKRARMLLPLFLTMFVFLVFVNQFSLLPFISQIWVSGPDGIHLNLFRTATTDLSLPLAMALFIVLGSQVWAFLLHPIRHIGNYFKVQEIFKIRKLGDIPFAIIEILLGLLDIIGEIAKVISLSARLFGNIFAGEVMYTVIIGLASFTQLFVPIPFVVLSVFSGFVQAYVFVFLAMQFMALTLEAVKSDAEKEEEQKTLITEPI